MTAPASPAAPGVALQRASTRRGARAPAAARSADSSATAPPWPGLIILLLIVVRGRSWRRSSTAHDPDVTDLSEPFQPPSAAHPLGTDRDRARPARATARTPGASR